MTDQPMSPPEPQMMEPQLPESLDELSPQELLDHQRQVLRGLGFNFEARYYLSGPMTGYPEYNYRRFEEVAGSLRAVGLAIESPHENPWPENHKDLHPNVLWKKMMELTRDQMKRCSGIILLSGWPQSKGARMELRYAIMQAWPVWYFGPDNMMHNMNKILSSAVDAEEVLRETDPPSAE